MRHNRRIIVMKISGEMTTVHCTVKKVEKKSRIGDVYALKRYNGDGRTSSIND